VVVVTGIVGFIIINSVLTHLNQLFFFPKKTLPSLGRDADMAKEKLS
jgi:hypothetical protein